MSLNAKKIGVLQKITKRNKMEIYKIYSNNPPHLFRKNSKYFITAATYKKIHYFKSDESKQIILDSILDTFSKFNWIIENWVILDNHYHLMADVKDNPNDLSRIIKNIHRFTAIQIKKNNPQAKQAEKIWYNYWDTCITYEKSYLARINYIWHNPVKHGYVENPEDWKFGSYYSRFRNEQKYTADIISGNPCDKLDLE
jgi:putative transposase